MQCKKQHEFQILLYQPLLSEISLRENDGYNTRVQKKQQMKQSQLRIIAFVIQKLIASRIVSIHSVLCDIRLITLEIQ